MWLVHIRSLGTKSSCGGIRIRWNAYVCYISYECFVFCIFRKVFSRNCESENASDRSGKMNGTEVATLVSAYPRYFCKGKTSRTFCCTRARGKRIGVPRLCGKHHGCKILGGDLSEEDGREGSYLPTGARLVHREKASWCDPDIQ